MAKQIAVEKGLENVSQALKDAGYQVVNLENVNLQNVQCVVVSGGSENLMGIQDAETKAPVINAQGLSPQEIIQRIEQYF
ncbi:MAG: YkuS family protein [Clostridia bacterium]|nr:YkuS family protein [Clostridia bacterium]